MHPFNVLLGLTPLLAATVAATAVPDHGAAQLEARNAAASPDSAPLEKRACKKNGCKCTKASWVTQGQYCGRCAAVDEYGSGNKYHIYECSDGGKDCCDYGESKKCSGSEWWNWCPK